MFKIGDFSKLGQVSVLKAAPKHPHFKIRNATAEENVAALIYEGPFRNVGSAVLVLLSWIGINERSISGPVRELHPSGPAHIKGEVQEKAVLELQIPIKT